jgi:hypothetical protein
MTGRADRPDVVARWLTRVVVALALLPSAVTTVRAQDVTELSLKAAFVYNFAKFTEWPPDVLTSTTPFTACVVGDPRFGDALARTVQGRLLSGRPIVVSRLQPDGLLKSCHLLYISGAAAEVARVVLAVKGSPVLTISDLDNFAQLGGIAHIFVEDGRMRFDLNLDLARRARLQLSSKLLSLAAAIHDGSGGPK